MPIRAGIRFEDVGFRYRGAERWAVRHLDLEIRAGEVVALVGENGAGKTTIVKLLSRLYDPTEGRITIDGIDLRRFELERAARPHRPHPPGFRALQLLGVREHRSRRNHPPR